MCPRSHMNAARIDGIFRESSSRFKKKKPTKESFTPPPLSPLRPNPEKKKKKKKKKKKVRKLKQTSMEIIKDRLQKKRKKKQRKGTAVSTTVSKEFQESRKCPPKNVPLGVSKQIRSSTGQESLSVCLFVCLQLPLSCL